MTQNIYKPAWLKEGATVNARTQRSNRIRHHHKRARHATHAALPRLAAYRDTITLHHTLYIKHQFTNPIKN